MTPQTLPLCNGQAGQLPTVGRTGMSPDGPTQGFIAIFSTGLSVLMFSSQQTPHSQRAPACPSCLPAG